MVKPPRSLEQIREHYEIEKQLAGRLRDSTRKERQTLYTTLYDELFRRVPYHPQLVRKSSKQESVEKVTSELQYLRAFLNRNFIFLEIGSGDCTLSLEVAKIVKKVYAVDVSKKITQQLITPSNFKFVLSDGTSIPVPAKSVNIAYSNQLMEHLHPDDALCQLQNIYKTLTQGGLYICITPNRINGPHDVSKYFDTIATGFHLKEYTISELHSLFRKAGFSKVKLFTPIKHKRIFLSVFWPKLCEKMLNELPYSLRKSISSSYPVAKFLGIILVGKK